MILNYCFTLTLCCVCVQCTYYFFDLCLYARSLSIYTAARKFGYDRKNAECVFLVHISPNNTFFFSSQWHFQYNIWPVYGQALTVWKMEAKNWGPWTDNLIKVNIAMLERLWNVLGITNKEHPKWMKFGRNMMAVWKWWPKYWTGTISRPNVNRFKSKYY